MNISPQMIYWITQCDGFLAVFIALAVLSFASICICVGLAGDLDNFRDGWKKIFFPKWFLPSLICFIISVMGILFVPSTKEMAMIYGIPAVLNSERIQNLSSETLDIAELGLKTLREKIKNSNGNR